MPSCGFATQLSERWPRAQTSKIHLHVAQFDQSSHFHLETGQIQGAELSLEPGFVPLCDSLTLVAIWAFEIVHIAAVWFWTHIVLRLWGCAVCIMTLAWQLCAQLATFLLNCGQLLVAAIVELWAAGCALTLVLTNYFWVHVMTPAHDAAVALVNMLWTAEPQSPLFAML